MIAEILRQFREVPEYVMALKGAVAVLAMGLPLYAGLRYFLHRRRLTISIWVTLNFMGVFILFAGLAFLLASPLASYLPGAAITAYLFLTCIIASTGAVSLIDVFFLQHYLSNVKRIYISPPLRTVIKVGVFCLTLLPVMRFVLHFNPLALIAIPTIATAVVALALQDTFKAFVAGVNLGHIIRLGQWIAFQNKEGRVIDINWARTVIVTLEGQHVFIPNTLLQTGVFAHYASGSPANQMSFKVSASYEAAPVRVKETLFHCVESVPGVNRTPPPQACLLEFADSGVVYGLTFSVEDSTQRVKIQDDVATRIWYAFKREGITIPYPTRTVQWQKSGNGTETASSRMAASLQRWRLAEAFYAEELLELTRWTHTRFYAPGELIVKEGAAGQSLFLVSEGTVVVLSSARGDERVATLGPGEIFGEMSFLTGALRSATVRAETAVEVLEIEKAGLQAVLAKRPELSDRLAEMVVARQAALAAQGPASPSPKSDNGHQTQGTLAKRIRQFFGLA